MRWFNAPFAIVECAWSTNDSVARTAKKLDAYSALPAGWHFGDGVPLMEQIRDVAERISFFGATYGLEMDAFPAADGSCSVAFYSGDRKMEVAINAVNDFIVYSEKGIGFDFAEAAPQRVHTLRDVQDGLLNLSGRVWYSSGFFTPSTTILKSSDSEATPSHQQTSPTKAAPTVPAASQ